jgi:hypothetical protein
LELKLPFEVCREKSGVPVSERLFPKEFADFSVSKGVIHLLRASPAGICSQETFVVVTGPAADLKM